MKKFYELTHDKLRRRCKWDDLKFKTTAELEPLDGIIGQERAVKALEFGLKIKTRGYNVYISGETGTGKTSYATKYITAIAENQVVPDDWCYVYNFDKVSQPLALNLPTGMAKKFAKDMEEFINVMQVEIAKAFDNDDYEKEKQTIIKEFQERRDTLFEKLNEDAEKQGFKVKSTASGIYFLPIVDGKPISEQDYNDLDDDAKAEIDEKSDQMQGETVEIIRKIKHIDKEAEKKINDWENRIALFAVGIHINDLKEKYRDFEKILKYLEAVQEDILNNLNDFRGGEETTTESEEVPPWAKKMMEPDLDKYKVNVIIDNSELKGVPVIVDYNPTYYNLLGRIEYENEMGTMTTDFTKIKAGLLHQANGGYLILQTKDVLGNVQAWETMKRSLRTKEIVIENMKEQMSLIAVSTLKPEPIPIDIKIILVGSNYLYHTLYDYDEDFKKFFKIKADFDEDMERNDDNNAKIARFIAAFCKRENALPFDKTAVAKIIEYCSRMVADQEKITAKFNDIVEILAEANTWTEIEGDSVVTEKNVVKAITEKIYRSNKYDRNLLELIEEGTIMIETEGKKVGQINGLTILDMGDFSFGKPSKITATTFIGKSGIVNIEREVEMSGTSHSKGVLILSGYMGDKFAQETPLSLSASLCFEQLYGGVDGDSASSTELYALLSSLSEVPIKQCIAVTGSVNQWGEIQPIGGVTEKVEGYFELCKKRGLTGEHGVIIPHQNVKNLVPRDEIVEAVKDGLFHIYPIKTIEEGIEILTDMPAGKKGKSGKYPKETIFELVSEKLKKYSAISEKTGE